MCAELEARCAASLGGGWMAYGTVKWSAESRYGTREMGRQVALRTGFRGGSGAGVRGVLGRP